MGSSVQPLFVSELIEASGHFSNAATADPISALLILLGNVLILGSMAALGYLTLGALVDLVIPESPGRAPPRQE